LGSGTRRIRALGVRRIRRFDALLEHGLRQPEDVPAGRPRASGPQGVDRLRGGSTEAVVRVISARPGLDPVIEVMTALTPDLTAGR
jgi:hypothetical protein